MPDPEVLARLRFPFPGSPWFATGDVAKLFDVTNECVRQWDTRGLLKVATRTVGGQRLWRREDVLAFTPPNSRGGRPRTRPR